MWDFTTSIETGSPLKLRNKKYHLSVVFVLEQRNSSRYSFSSSRTLEFVVHFRPVILSRKEASRSVRSTWTALVKAVGIEFIAGPNYE
ncbi:hypothetical protein L596_016760 [Steinernema carpocapsae]|uniref:Uncharacterized protein n=1 Tax=Steinernema carpocapsae TaxID=34508 RepID=A0A4U5NJU3_STECR|nr:hypothetical protein L596_016760 [Steinernema carpocapsae]